MSPIMAYGMRLVVSALFFIATFLVPVARADNDGLYAVTVIVTGRDNLAERSRGVREALPLVLTKVSVDANVAGRATEQGLIDDPESFVVDFDYRDRKEGIQISDEQGTRDRSFELTVRFDPEMVDAVIRELSARPWHGPRPEIGIELTINDWTSRYRLTQVAEKGYGQRMALTDKAKALGLSVRIPETEDSTAEAPVRLEGQIGHPIAQL